MGLPKKLGPRAYGVHKNAWDYPRRRRWKCQDCGATWPEGGMAPWACDRDTHERAKEAQGRRSAAAALLRRLANRIDGGAT